MDATAVIGILASAVAALFGALNITINRQLANTDKQSEAWKDLYLKECDKHEKTREKSAEDIRELTGAVRDLTRVVEQVPKRREDWEPSERRGTR